jgi:hypothetical protein
MDLLSAVLRELRLESAAYRVLELRAPWRLRFDGGLRGVHVVVEGCCELRLDDGPCAEVAPETSSSCRGRTPTSSVRRVPEAVRPSRRWTWPGARRARASSSTAPGR